MFIVRNPINMFSEKMESHTVGRDVGGRLRKQKLGFPSLRAKELDLFPSILLLSVLCFSAPDSHSSLVPSVSA